MSNEEAKNVQTIWLAGGCFWGVQAYFDKIDGVLETKTGYANGSTLEPKYEDLKKTGHAETVQVTYDADIIDLKTILAYFFAVIDPTAKNRQGKDVGKQYRTGIYYKERQTADEIMDFVYSQRDKYDKPIMTEVKELVNFHIAEEEHQNYLDKNPHGYCHVNLFAKPDFLEENYIDDKSPRMAPLRYQRPSNQYIKKTLTKMQYEVTQKGATEPAFQNEFQNHYERGIYVDIITGEPLFASVDKLDIGSGWPVFSKPIVKGALVTKEYEEGKDMHRRQVKSAFGDNHIGFVVDDGPKEKGGLRFIVNSAALRFVPYDRMQEEEYIEYMPLI